MIFSQSAERHVLKIQARLIVFITLVSDVRGRKQFSPVTRM